MSGYTPLFGSIITSSIWNESNETRIVWITMLAMADMYGVVEGSVAGLAVVARVSLEACEKAIADLSAPDKYSRTKESEGRRIIAVEGGWKVINHTLYRNRAKSRAAYMRIYRDKKKNQEEERIDQTSNIKHQTSNSVTGVTVTQHNVTNGDITVTPPLPTKKRAPPFVPPTVEEVKAYCAENNYEVDAKAFIKYYAATDDGIWRDRDGKLVKNWKQKIISTWSKKDERTPKNRRNTGFDYGKDPDSIEIRA